MNTRLLTVSVALVGLLLPTTLIAQDVLPPAATNPAQPPAEPMPDNEGAPDGIQALTRGPVHEAFAEPVSVEPAPGPVVQQQPPEAIEELPPEARPDDANSQWIPGYWIFSDEEKDFLWVSGIWRSVPSGMRWVPGYWTKAEGGFQRAGGFWTSGTNQEVTYLPNPPETVEAGPNVPAPSSDHFWVPGCWIWEADRYQWRGGYWTRVQPDWLWIPAHYCWTPRGFVFTDGYWDYPLARRGVIFAPVHFHRSVYSRPGFVYTPSVIINSGFLTSHFFVRPHNHHYYFGDYYADRYTQFGFQPWFAFQRTRGWHDPIFVHQRWSHSRTGDDWTDRLASNHRFFTEREDLRPRHTFAEQRRFTEELAQRNDAKLPKDIAQQVALGASVRDVLGGGAKLGQTFERIPDAQRRELREQTNQMRDLAQQRVQTEAKADRQADTKNQPGAQSRELGRFKLPELTGRDTRPARTADERERTGERPRLDGAQPGERRTDDRPEQPDRSAPRPESIGPRQDRAPTVPGQTIKPNDQPDRRPDRRTTPEADRIPLPGAERQPVRSPGGQPAPRPEPGERRTPLEADRPATPSPPGAERSPDRNDRRTPDAERTRIPLPGAERQPDRIPGGTPGIGPSQTPSGPGTSPTLPVPDLNDRRIPSTAPGIPGTGPGARRPEQSPQFPQPGTSPRQPQNSAERQPLRQPQSTGNRMTIPRTPEAQSPRQQPAPQPRVAQTPERAPTPQPAPSRVETRKPVSPAPAPQARQPEPRPQPRVNRSPEPSRSPQPRVEAQRPSNPAPSPGRSSGGGSGNRGAGGGNPGKGDKGDDKNKK